MLNYTLLLDSFLEIWQNDLKSSTILFNILLMLNLKKYHGSLLCGKNMFSPGFSTSTSNKLMTWEYLWLGHATYSRHACETAEQLWNQKMKSSVQQYSYNLGGCFRWWIVARMGRGRRNQIDTTCTDKMCTHTHTHTHIYIYIIFHQSKQKLQNCTYELDKRDCIRKL